jgi:hypothetical protein
LRGLPDGSGIGTAALFVVKVARCDNQNL